MPTLTMRVAMGRASDKELFTVTSSGNSCVVRRLQMGGERETETSGNGADCVMRRETETREGREEREIEKGERRGERRAREEREGVHRTAGGEFVTYTLQNRTTFSKCCQQ